MDQVDEDTLFLDLHSLTTRKWTSHLNVSLTTLHVFFFRQSQNALSDDGSPWRQTERGGLMMVCVFFLGKFYVVERLLLSPRKSSHSRRLECVACSVERNDHGVDGIFDSSTSTIARVERLREEKKKSWWWSTIDSQRHGIFVFIECGWERKKKWTNNYKDEEKRYIYFLWKLRISFG